MTEKRTITTDTVVVEFDGDLYNLVRELGKIFYGYHRILPDRDDLWWDTDEAIAEYQTLHERLNDLSPEGYTFGGNPVHPMCFGYWPNN